MNYLILLITCIIDLFICFDFFNSFFIRKHSFSSFRNRCIVFIFAFTMQFFINLLNLSYLNTAAATIILLLYISVIYHGSFKNKIIYVIFACSISWGCEFLFLVLLEIPSFILKQYSIINLGDIPWHVFTLLLLKYLIFGIFKQFSKKSHNHIENKIYLYYLCLPFSSIGIMFLTYYSGIDFNVSFHTKVMLCVYFAIMQIGNIIVFYAFQKYSQEVYNSMQQKLIISDQNMKLEYYNQLQALDDKHKEFIHNTNHYIKAIGTLITENKKQDALAIINELNIELESNATILYSDNSVLNSILSEKKTYALKNNVNMDIYVEPCVDFSDISDVDLITILSNLIDNAIEASIKCIEQHSVYIRIYMENHGNFCVTKITNRFDGELKITGTALLSTKKENGIHGVGLKSAERAAEKCGGCIECYTEDNYFVAVLLLPSS